MLILESHGMFQTFVYLGASITSAVLLFIAVYFVAMFAFI